MDRRNVAQREATPLGACRATPAKYVSRGRAFRQHLGQPLLRCLNSGIGQPLLRSLNSGILALAMPSPCAGEKESTSCRLPCGPLDHDSPPHRGGKIKIESHSHSHSHSATRRGFDQSQFTKRIQSTSRGRSRPAADVRMSGSPHRFRTPAAHTVCAPASF
jgi:hypothetical protein